MLYFVSDQTSTVVTNAPSADKIIAGGVLKIMVKTYTEEEKQKYCVGFKKCTLPITDYADKMGINVEDLKVWLKDYKEPAPFGAINLSSLMEQHNRESNKISFKFETEAVQIEIQENFDKKLLKRILDLLEAMCNVK